MLSYELLMWLIRSAARAAGTRVPFAANCHSETVKRFAEYLEKGTVPGVRKIKAELGCGQPRAQEARAELEQVLAAL